MPRASSTLRVRWLTPRCGCHYPAELWALTPLTGFARLGNDGSTTFVTDGATDARRDVERFRHAPVGPAPARDADWFYCDPQPAQHVISAARAGPAGDGQASLALVVTDTENGPGGSGGGAAWVARMDSASPAAARPQCRTCTDRALRLSAAGSAPAATAPQPGLDRGRRQHPVPVRGPNRLGEPDDQSAMSTWIGHQYRCPSLLPWARSCTGLPWLGLTFVSLFRHRAGRTLYRAPDRHRARAVVPVDEVCAHQSAARPRMTRRGSRIWLPSPKERPAPGRGQSNPANQLLLRQSREHAGMPMTTVRRRASAPRGPAAEDGGYTLLAWRSSSDSRSSASPQQVHPQS